MALFRCWILAAILFACTVCADEARAQGQPLRVAITVVGGDQAKLGKQLSDLSELERIRTQGVASLGTVRRLAVGDTERFTKALHAKGFYDSKIETKISATEADYLAEFVVTPGKPFQITAYEIRYTDLGGAERPASPAQLKVETDGSPRGEQILAIQQQIATKLRAQGYPSAQITERRAEANLATGQAKIVFLTQSGLLASFGPTMFPDGLRTQKKYLQTFVTWRQGERFDLDRTAELRDELAETGLFTVVAVEPGTTAPDGITPVEVALVERKPRTFGAGVSYSTNLGVGAQTSWVHRNLQRRGERLQADLNISQVEQSAKIEFRNPRVRKRTDLVLSASIKNEDNEAFSGLTFDSLAGLQHKYSKRITGKIGVELFISHTEDTFGRHESYLIGFPVGASYNDLDDLLNPTRGLNATLTFVPYAGASDGPISFSQAEGTASYHYPLGQRARYVAAAWTRLGASLGANVSDIPPDKRYYAGGAGSVRGYGYRLVGPTDVNGDPIGGRSVLEGGVEFRFPVYGDFGGAAFVEGGGISERGVFAFDQGMRYGAGLGVRYYTAVGPIRADIAIPLDPRADIDDPIQFYISLGQAF